METAPHIEGSAIYDYASDRPIANCTFTNNTASGVSPVGVIAYRWTGADVYNCIIFGNSGYSITPLSINTVGGLAPSQAPTVAYSNVQGGWTGTGNINTDPLFLRNPSAGSDGLWNTADDDYGDLRLKRLSPCIDAGTLATPSPIEVTDFLGEPRVYGGTVDMGADEHMNYSPVARNDSYTFKVGVLMYLDVLANDSDPDNDALTITSVTHPGAFSAVVDSTRKRIVTRSFNTGTYTVRYSISDGRGGAATATVTMVVIP